MKILSAALYAKAFFQNPTRVGILKLPLSSTVRLMDSNYSSLSHLDPVPGFGQPTAETHPHLLKPEEVVPGVALKEFVERRDRLVKSIHSCKPACGHIVIIPSAEVQYMTEKIPYVFRQNTDFRYFTGCLEPDSALLLAISETSSYQSIIFVRDKDRHAELWEGPRTGVEKAKSMFCVDDSRPSNEFFKVLSSIYKSIGKAIVWYDFYNPPHVNIHKAILSFIKDSQVKDLESPKKEIHKLRLIKSNSEQVLLTKAAAIASKAIQKSIEVTHPGITEHQLFATVDYHCRMNGAEFLAYPPVVASGKNANVIHYIENNQTVRNGDLILMDAGCELHGYCSDITRTWPSCGDFSETQKILYEIILDVQYEVLRKCAYCPTLDDLFKTMCITLGQRLKEAHVLSNSAQKENLEKVAFNLCPHHVSHYLGMDVHDTGAISRDIPLREGMVFTVEPGIYISKENTLIKPEFRGCGIRIEDDVLICHSGPKVLSSCPKEPEELVNLLH